MIETCSHYFFLNTKTKSGQILFGSETNLNLNKPTSYSVQTQINEILIRTKW